MYVFMGILFSLMYWHKKAEESTLDSIDAAQIYFGPGFEERIEMEMEQ